MRRYIAYHVDIFGRALATYQLVATDDAAAQSEAAPYLKLHASIEVWEGARFIARLVRNKPTQYWIN